MIAQAFTVTSGVTVRDACQVDVGVCIIPNQVKKAAEIIGEAFGNWSTNRAIPIRITANHLQHKVYEVKEPIQEGTTYYRTEVKF